MRLIDNSVHTDEEASQTIEQLTVSTDISDILVQCMALRSIGEVDAAVKKSIHALEQSANNLELIQFTCELLLQTGKPAQAVGLLRPLATVENPAQDILRGYAVSLELNGEDIEALVQYKRLLNLYPSDLDALLRTTKLLCAHAKSAETVEFIADKAQHFDHPVWISIQCAACLAHFGDRKNAKEILNSINKKSLPEQYQYLVAGILQEDDLIAGHSPESIQHMFDSVAESFDENLTALDYQGPRLLTDLLSKVDFAGSSKINALDAGCGTGLCGPVIKDVADHLIGVDLSQKMLDVAATKGCYDHLRAMDLLNLEKVYPPSFDLIVCFDTLCYFGDLMKPLSALRNCLNNNGVLIFTVEQATNSNADHQLKPTGRYGHQKEYLLSVLESVGFSEVVALIDDAIRLQYGEPIDGFAVLVYRSMGSE